MSRIGVFRLMEIPDRQAGVGAATSFPGLGPGRGRRALPFSLRYCVLKGGGGHRRSIRGVANAAARPIREAFRFRPCGDALRPASRVSARSRRSLSVLHRRRPVEGPDPFVRTGLMRAAIRAFNPGPAPPRVVRGGAAQEPAPGIAPARNPCAPCPLTARARGPVPGSSAGAPVRAEGLRDGPLARSGLSFRADEARSLRPSLADPSKGSALRRSL